MSQTTAASLVSAVNPEWGANADAAAKAATIEFYKGGPSSPAGQTMMLRTALGHAGEVSDALEEMRKADPGTFQRWANEAANSNIPFGAYLLQQAANKSVQGTAMGVPLARYQTVYPLFANETNRLYVGGPGSQGSREEIAAPLSAARSYPELTAALQTGAHAIESRASAIEDRYASIHNMPGMAEYGTKKIPVIDPVTHEVKGSVGQREFGVINQRVRGYLDKIEQRDRDANPQHYAPGTPGGAGSTATAAPKIFNRENAKKAGYTDKEIDEFLKAGPR